MIASRPWLYLHWLASCGEQGHFSAAYQSRYLPSDDRSTTVTESLTVRSNSLNNFYDESFLTLLSRPRSLTMQRSPLTNLDSGALHHADQYVESVDVPQRFHVWTSMAPLYAMPSYYRNKFSCLGIALQVHYTTISTEAEPVPGEAFAAGRNRPLIQLPYLPLSLSLNDPSDIGCALWSAVATRLSKRLQYMPYPHFHMSPS
ncbi:hypothetical protein B0H15DRAFT_452666 [Mycena belliarum]|uniref:Uncharacterized protein n=1 Tax=Mycena belliarum TaxID=1033014 RepID=A0AAD6U077_9AGAR|nr:hypothetical protein B0H15DRAFT_452666 [Mycena belliae]